MLLMLPTVGKFQRLFLIVTSAVMFQNASCLSGPAECEALLHEHPRTVSVTGLRDSMNVGDTIHFEIKMPWVFESSLNGVEYDLRDLDDPGDHPLVMFSTHAPLGFTGTNQVRAFDINDMFSPGNDWTFYPGEGITFGDSTSTHWITKLSLVFSKPGRTYVTFKNGRTNEGHGTEQGTVLGEGITIDGCDERIVTRQILQGYEYNEEMISDAEEYSEVKITNGVWGLQEKYGAFYVLVFE